MAEEGHRSPLNPGFLAGWLFFALAFIGAAAETSLGRLGLTSAHDLWHALDPGSLVIAKIRLDEILGAGTWDSVVRTALAPPAWALFGVPAALLIWLFRPHRASDVAEVEEAIKYYDMLVKAANEEGAVDDPPRWQELKEPEADERPDPVELGRDPIDHYMEQWVPPKPEEDAEPPNARGRKTTWRKSAIMGRPIPAWTKKTAFPAPRKKTRKRKKRNEKTHSRYFWRSSFVFRNPRPGPGARPVSGRAATAVHRLVHRLEKPVRVGLFLHGQTVGPNRRADGAGRVPVQQRHAVHVAKRHRHHGGGHRSPDRLQPIGRHPEIGKTLLLAFGGDFGYRGR